MEKPPLEQLSPAVVRAQVQRYWSVFIAKAYHELEEFYAPGAIVFGSAATRPEAARLAIVRRTREYLSPEATVHCTLGRIDVCQISDTAAIASYTFEFQADNVAGPMSTLRQENIPKGRATQVFVVNHDGSVHIIHEHLSAAERISVASAEKPSTT